MKTATVKTKFTLSKDTLKDLTVRSHIQAGGAFRSNDVLSPCGSRPPISIK